MLRKFGRGMSREVVAGQDGKFTIEAARNQNYLISKINSIFNIGVSANVTASTVSVVSPGAGVVPANTGTEVWSFASTATIDQTIVDINKAVTLVNELKTDVNQLVTDLNATITSLNDLKDKLRTAGVIT